MRVLLLTMIIFLSTLVYSQDFNAEFYFEDNDGRRDTLAIIDPMPPAITPMDVNIVNEPLDSFDVRFIRYVRSSPSYNPPLWDCLHLAGEISLDDESLFSFSQKESKSFSQIGPKCDEERFSGLTVEFFIPYNSSFPITISWDGILFEDSCRSNSFISEIPYPLVQIVTDSLWCEEKISHPLILMNESNSVILERPNFTTLRRQDSTIVSVYSLFVASTSYTGDPFVSVDETKSTDNINIYPNPVEDKLYLETTEQGWGFQILNLQGQQIMQGQYQDNIGVSQLPSGIYFLQLSRENELYEAIKFVKE